MSIRKLWCPSESLVTELPAPQPTVSEAGSDLGRRNGVEANSGNGAGATLSKTKPKITRRRTPTVDTSAILNDSTNSNEKLDTEQCGRGMTSTTYATIENAGRASAKTLVSNLMQRSEPVLSKDTDFHGWLHHDPLLQWRNIFLSKSEQHASTSRTVKDNHRTRRHRSEEFVFRHYKDTSEYMKYYRKHCCLTSLSVPSLPRSSQYQKSKPKPVKSKQEKEPTRPSTRAVFRTINDSGANQQEHSTDSKQASMVAANSNRCYQQSPKLAELENRLSLSASIMSPSTPLPLVPRPTPPSIVNRESTSIVLCGSGSSSSEKYYRADGDVPPAQNKETVVKSTTSTAEGVELPPINNCYHSLSDSSISHTIRPHTRQCRRVLLTDPLVGAEGELEDHYHNGLDNNSDPTLISSISITQQSKSITKLESGDENPSSSSATDDSWMHPFPHFRAPSSSRYDKMTREQLLSSKAHALGLLSSKNWIKSAKSGTKAVDDNAPQPARIKSSPPGRIPKMLHSSNHVPTLEGVNEDHHVCEATKTKTRSSKATYVTDTISNTRLKTAGPGTHSHNTPTPQSSQPIYTSQGSRPHHQRTTSSMRHRQLHGRKQSAIVSKISKRQRLATAVNHDQQLSGSYVGQVNERLHEILKVKHKNSTFIRNSALVS